MPNGKSLELKSYFILEFNQLGKGKNWVVYFTVLRGQAQRERGEGGFEEGYPLLL